MQIFCGLRLGLGVDPLDPQGVGSWSVNRGKFRVRPSLGLGL